MKLSTRSVSSYTKEAVMGLKMIWDMDPGIDDALALILALKSSEIEIIGITTVAGNAPVEFTSSNARRVLEYLGNGNIPVAQGAKKPLTRPLIDARDFHGADGLGECSLSPSATFLHPQPAHEFLTNLVREKPGGLYLLATGPLTNLALAFRQNADLPRLLKGLILMGGAYGLTPYAKGNQTSFAEFNIWEDPEAAQIVFRQARGITAVGLDITQNPSTWLKSEHLEKLKSGPPAAQLAAKLAGYLIERDGHCELHDLLALAALLQPSLFEFVSTPVEVVTRELERGRTILAQGKKPQVQVARSVEGKKFLELFLSRVLQE